MSVAAILVLVVVGTCVLAAFVYAPKGWRTVVVNAVIGGLTLVIGLFESVQAMLPDKWAVYGVIAVNGGNVLLRWLTDTPMGKSTPELPPPPAR